MDCRRDVARAAFRLAAGVDSDGLNFHDRLGYTNRQTLSRRCREPASALDAFEEAHEGRCAPFPKPDTHQFPSLRTQDVGPGEEFIVAIWGQDRILPLWHGQHGLDVEH